MTTGIYDTGQLLELLPKYGRNDLAHDLATRESFPSWGWMLRHDATTLWEHWKGSGTTALITLPKGGEAAITESGKTLEESSGISNIQRHATQTTFQLGSGSYRFSCEYIAASRNPLVSEHGPSSDRCQRSSTS